jgi:hypothetical protein
METEGLNKNSFSKEIDLSSNVTITRILNEKRKASAYTCKKIIERFPKYSYTWLLTGEGSMLKTSGSVSEPEVSYGKEGSSNELVNYLKEQIKEQKEEHKKEIKEKDNKIDNLNKEIKMLHEQIGKLKNQLATADVLEQKKGASHTTGKGKTQLAGEESSAKG